MRQMRIPYVHYFMNTITSPPNSQVIHCGDMMTFNYVYTQCNRFGKRPTTLSDIHEAPDVLGRQLLQDQDILLISGLFPR